MNKTTSFNFNVIEVIFSIFSLIIGAIALVIGGILFGVIFVIRGILAAIIWVLTPIFCFPRLAYQIFVLYMARGLLFIWSKKNNGSFSNDDMRKLSKLNPLIRSCHKMRKFDFESICNYNLAKFTDNHKYNQDGFWKEWWDEIGMHEAKFHKNDHYEVMAGAIFSISIVAILSISFLLIHFLT